MTDKRIKVGVFGVGSLGQWHARVYSELDNVELAGVYDIDIKRARSIAKKYKTRAYDNISELAQAIEAASVAVPTDKHFGIFTELADYNLHMLMEKPIASSTEEAEKMVKIAQQKNILLQVGHVERFNPVMTFLDSRLTNPRFIEAIRIAPYPPSRKGAKPRGTEVSVVHDLMIHDLDVILHLIPSKIKQINATGIAVLSETEDIANVRIGFENGCVANITASRISREQIRKIRVFQEDTYVSLDYMKQAGVICSKNGGKIKVDKVPIEKKNALDLELESFANCVIMRRTPVVTGEHGFESLKLAVEICRKIRNDPS